MEPHKRFRWFDPRNWSFAYRLSLIMILLILTALAGVTLITIRTVQTELVDKVGESIRAQSGSLSDQVGAFLGGKITQIQVLATSNIVKDTLTERDTSYTGNEAEILAEIQALDAAWAVAADDDPFIVRTISSDEKVNPAGHALADFLAAFPIHTEIFLTDRYGATVAATGRLSDYYQADEAWWQATWNNGQGAVYISQPEFDQSAGITALLFGVPVFNHRGDLVGVLRSTLIMDGLFATISEFRMGQTGHAILFDRSDEPLFDPYAETGEDVPELTAELRQAIISEEQGYRIIPDIDGDTSIFGYAAIELREVKRAENPLPEDGHEHAHDTGGHEDSGEGESRRFERLIAAAVDNLGWGIVIQQETFEAFTAVNQIIWNIIVVALVVVGLTSLAALLLAQTITRPLTTLSAAAEQIGAGNLDAPLPSASDDEIGRLTTSFEKMSVQLRNLIASLEERVAARTQRLEIVASLSERLSAILKPDELLAEVVNQVKNSFGYYHAHIYLLDDKGEKLVMAEGTGLAGAEMKAKGHAIGLDAPTSLVARAARTGEIVRVDNVREARDWLPNPLLPETHSEMAVPITLGVEEKVVGVLDVQQDKIAGLDEGDANLLRSLANQVAVAVRNARHFAEVEASLREAHEIQQRYIEQAWDRTRVTRKNTGRIQFSLGESTTLNETIIVDAQQQALRYKKPTVVALNGQQNHHALVAPITLRNVVIGDLQLHEVDPDRKWTESELALINAVIDQVAQAAETLRLLDETQERASREQLVSQISSKMRGAPDMESLLKVAVSELSRVLNPARTFVHMDLKEGREPDEMKSEDSGGQGFEQPIGSEPARV